MAYLRQKGNWETCLEIISEMADARGLSDTISTAYCSADVNCKA